MARTFRSIAAWVLLLALIAAGANSCGRRAFPHNNALPSAAAPPYLEDLSRLTTPAGVDERLFSHLKTVLARAFDKLASAGSVALGPPIGDENVVKDLQSVDEGAGEFRLVWHYRNTADFDQNGKVEIADITPLAQHFGHTVGTDPQDIVIDVSGNSRVGIEDITPLAVHYLQEVEAYSIRWSEAETGSYTEVGRVELEDATNDGSSFLAFSWDLPSADAGWFRVVPLDTDDYPGVEGDPYYFEPTGDEPNILSVSPLAAVASSNVQFTASVTGSELLEYAWVFGDAAVPAMSDLASPTVLVAEVDEYQCSLTVSNYLAADTFEFTLAVGEVPQVLSVTPLEGQTGAVVAFSAAVSGTPPFDYYWDFGMGASPNLSDEEAPAVTLGAPGIYDASLTLGSPFGQQFFPFTLTVTEIPPANRIAIAVSDADISVGEAATITVFAEDMVYPFQTLSSAIMGYDLSILEPDIDSFNLGSPGGGQWELDGIWGLGSYTILPLDPQYFFQHLEGSDWVYHTHPVNPYLNSADVSIAALSGLLPERMGGDLYSFAFTGISGGAVSLVFLPQYSDAGGSTVDCTYYVEEGAVPHLYSRYDSAVINVHPAATTAPTVNWIYPLLADTGSAQVFQAGVSGSPPFIYDWDFGPGATPSTSADALPLVVMGTPGEYAANLAVTGPGGEDSHDFVYRIPDPNYDELENNDSFAGANQWSTFPFSDFRGSIGPGGYDGDNDDYYAFTASPNQFFEAVFTDQSGVGDVTLRLYDVSETQVAESSGTTSTKAVSYVCSAGGACYLRVTAGAAGADYLLSGYLAAPQNWTASVVADLDTPPDSASLAVVGIYPALAYSHNPDIDAGSQLYYSMNSLSNGSGVWTIYQVGTEERGYGASLASIGGYPGIAYTNDEGVVRFAYCDAADGSGIWSGYDVSYPVDVCYEPSLAEVAGYPAIAYYDETIPGLVYAVCDNAEGSGNWTRVVVHDSSGVLRSPSLFKLNNQNPAISYLDETSGDLRLAYSETPGGTGAWTLRPPVLGLVTADRYLTSLAVTDSHPAIAFSDGSRIRFTINSAEDGSGSWSFYPPPYTDAAQSGFGIKRYNGRPTLIYQGPLDTLRYAYNPNSDGSGYWDWWIASLNARMISTTAYTIVSGRPACVYYDTATGELKYKRQPVV